MSFSPETFMAVKHLLNDQAENQETVINQRTGEPVKIWAGSQEQYEALDELDPDTSYLYPTQ